MPRRKPDLSTGGGGVVDPEFLPLNLQRELMDHLAAAPMTVAQKVGLIAHCNEVLQLWDFDLVSGREQLEQLEKLAASARRLLAAIGGMSKPARDAFAAHADLMSGSSPPDKLPESVKTRLHQRSADLLSDGWDWVHALEVNAEYVRSRYQLSRQSKPDQLIAHAVVSVAAQYVWRTTGSRPKKGRTGWFLDFCSRLCEHLELPSGSTVVDTGIDASAG